MACKTSYELHHNFAKLAEESGFTFNVHRPRIHIDWNKLCSIDLDKLIRDRNFITIEQHINDVLDCVLESEFDVRILDQGVVKLFRLAQLTVEYQQFCRHHLDRSVVLLREELIAMTQEVERSRKEQRHRDEEIRKLRKKAKYSYKTPLTYGNDNIATMILKTLSHNGDTNVSSYFGNRSQNYNKCTYCDKVFLNQLYLKGHLVRRHQSIADEEKIVTKDTKKTDICNTTPTENTKLQNEIEELKNKLKNIITYPKENETKTTEIQTDNIFSMEAPYPDATNKNKPEDDTVVQESSNYSKILLDKINEWKTEEQEKYKTEIKLLKDQIIENINVIKDKRNDNLRHEEIYIINELRNTINEQNSEISELKETLTKVIKNLDEKKKEVDLNHKMQLIEAPSIMKVDAGQQYDNLMKSWHSNTEPNIPLENKKERCLSDMATSTDVDKLTTETKKKEFSALEKKRQNFVLKEKQMTLEDLHKKTQELLNCNSSSESSSSETKSVAIEDNNHFMNVKIQQNLLKNENTYNNDSNHLDPKQYSDEVRPKSPKSANVSKSMYNKPKRNLRVNPRRKGKMSKNTIKFKNNKEIESNQMKGEIIQGSPAKIVRAKITEEVQKRLVAVGVDPLKMGVCKDVFYKQKAHLQKEEELKKKKIPSYEKVRHNILVYLHSKAAEEAVTGNLSKNSIRKEKPIKNFRLSSVLSNVKNRALSLIKPVDKRDTTDHANIADESVKKGTLLLKTPPSSVSVSPIHQKQIRTEAKLNEIQNIRKQRNIVPKKLVKAEITRNNISSDSDSTHGQSTHEVLYIKDNKTQKSKKSVESQISSPLKRPATVNGNYSSHETTAHEGISRAQSSSGLYNNNSHENERLITNQIFTQKNGGNVSSFDRELTAAWNLKKQVSDDDVFMSKVQINAKSVLKNAPSNSSLSKKKVLFDLDANQTKSVSASPSQSITEKSDIDIHNVETLNLEEEWDISSIESIPVKTNKDLNKNEFQAPTKIAELTQRIESQLARRGNLKPPGVVGGIDILRGLATGGSNTSIGSSLLGDTDEHIATNTKKTKNDTYESDLDLSEFSVDGIIKDYKLNIK